MRAKKKNRPDKDLNLEDSIARLNDRITSFENYFGAESEVAQHFKKLAYSPEGIKFKDGKINPKESTLEAVQASLKMVPITRTYVAELKKELRAKKGVTNKTFDKKQLIIEANARVKILNEFSEQLLLDDYHIGHGCAEALANKDYSDLLNLIHHKGEEWSYSDLQAAIDLAKAYLTKALSKKND